MNNKISELSEVFEWKKEYCINVEEIDSAHQKLFSIVRRLLKNLYQGDYEKNRLTCIEAVKYLKRYTIQHFAEEEAFQLKIGYGGYENHKRIHDSMREITIPALEKQMVRTNYSEQSVEHFAGVCAAWLTAHIMFEDQAIIGKVKSVWEKEIGGNALSVLQKHAENFVHTLFNISVEAENLNYDAYDIGEAFYYYLIYRGDNNDLYRSIVILGRELVLKTLGKLMGKELKSLNEVAVSMMQELSQNFVTNFLAQYADDHFVLVGDGLVDKDAFKDDFKKLHPDISILWNSQYGHLAFCLKTVKYKSNS